MKAIWPKNASETLKRAIGAILSSVDRQVPLVYGDSIIIFFKFPDEPADHLHQVLTLGNEIESTLKMKIGSP